MSKGRRIRVLCVDDHPIVRETTGFKLIRDILTLSPSARTIVLTSFEGDVDIERALAAGAKGYVVKGMVREELLEAIRAVHAGKRHVPSAIAAKLVDHLASEKLTQREMDVLKEVAEASATKRSARRFPLLKIP